MSNDWCRNAAQEIWDEIYRISGIDDAIDNYRDGDDEFEDDLLGVFTLIIRQAHQRSTGST